MAAPDENASPSSEEGDNTPLVITISRQFGSGGREIGQALGRKLNIPVFDETLIELTAKEAGLTSAYVRKHEQEVRKGVLYNLYMQNYLSIGWSPTNLTIYGWPKPTQSQSSQIKGAALSLAAAQTPS